MVNANRARWEKGDFTRIAETMRGSGEALVAGLGVGEGTRMLDLGCGDGTTAIPAARSGAEVLGVDIAANLVAAGNERAAELGLDNIRFREGDATDLNGLDDLKGMRLRYGRLSGPVIEKAGATLVPLAAGEFFYHLQQGKVDGGEMSTPAMDAALGFDKLGLPYYMPGWQQPSAVLDFLMRKDKWQELPASLRAQIETACHANIAWTLSRAPHIQALALEKLQASGVVIKQWSPVLLDAFRANTTAMLQERASRDPEFAAAWANQKAFVTQGMTWRTMSRLP